MSEHHGPAKETDITAVLVIAFVLVVGVLIAKTAGDFTKQTTSTSSRASAPKAKTLTSGVLAPVNSIREPNLDAFCYNSFYYKYVVLDTGKKDKDGNKIYADRGVYNNMNGSVFAYIATTSDFFPHCDANQIQVFRGLMTDKDKTNKFGVCCANVESIYYDINRFCGSKNRNLDLKCRLDGCNADMYGANAKSNNDFKVDLSTKCDKMEEKNIVFDGGTCCLNPPPSPSMRSKNQD